MIEAEPHSSQRTDPAGYDTARVEAWIAKHIPSLGAPLRWTKLEGGHSNLTYLLEAQLEAQSVDGNGSQRWASAALYIAWPATWPMT